MNRDALIEKLEAGPVGSRELDIEIYQQVREEQSPLDVRRLSADREYTPLYTTSLDAKLPGENIVCVRRFGVQETKWEAFHRDDATQRDTTAIARTEALARRCAALKAKQDL